jgi:pyruvate-formate lyase
MSKSRGQRIWDRLRDKRDTEHVSIWRGRLQYRAYLETEGQPTYIRRARAFEMLMDKLPIYIDDEQLLAGDTCTEPMSLEWFPELTCGWLKNYLDSGSATYSFGDISMEEMREIAEYWAKNSAKDSFVEYMGDSWKKWVADTSEFGAWLLGSDGGVQSQRGWNVLDFEKALRLGYRGIVEEIDQAMARLKGYTNERLVKEQFYSAIKRELLAAIRFSNRYADLAEKMAESAPEGRREELLELARICRKVPEYPAGSFHEAVQNMWFTYLMVYWETLAAGVSLGRVDQYLYPYYKADIEAGVLDREKALEILECLRVKFSCRRDFADTTIRRMVSGWTQFANCTLGGQHGDG